MLYFHLLNDAMDILLLVFCGVLYCVHKQDAVPPPIPTCGYKDEAKISKLDEMF